MLTYKPSSPSSRPEGYDKPLLLLLLCFIWIITGLWGHQPWKGDELSHIGPVIAFAREGMGWLPMVGGEAVLQRPPLYYWIATLLGQLLSPWLLPFHDAARLATGIFVALALLGVGQATRLLYGPRIGRLAVLTLLGSIGMLIWGHMLSADVAAFAGLCWTLWGCAAAHSNKRHGVLLLAGGVGMTFWSGTLFQALLALALPIALTLSPLWRQPSYTRTLLAALPLIAALCCAWPLLLWLKNPELLRQWLTEDGSMHLTLAPLAADGLSYYLRRLSWLALPALPLALWNLWQKRRQWGAAEHLGLISFTLWFLALTLITRKQDVLALPLLASLALLAAGGIDSLRRGAAAAMNWFGMLAFGVFGLYVWVAWSAATLGVPARLGRQAHRLAPDFVAALQPLAVAIAVLFSVFWLWAITRKRPLARQAITNWTLGITLLWALVVALTLPWFDAIKSYRRMSEDLVRHLPADYGCIDASAVSPGIRGALAYHGDVQVRRRDIRDCRLILLRNGRERELPLVWSGAPSWARGKEVFRLYRITP